MRTFFKNTFHAHLHTFDVIFKIKHVNRKQKIS